MRRLLGVVAVIVGIAVSASGARAGGSWLELRGVEGIGGPSDGPWGGWAAPGSTVQMQGDFCRGQQADPSAGPWSAYLRPDPRGPERYLGTVTVTNSSGSGCPFVASITFTVPQVDPGQYWVDVCNDPECSTGVGDLIGGIFTVASTSLEAQLLVENASLNGSHQRLVKERNRLRARSSALEDALREATERLDSVQRAHDLALERLEAAAASRRALTGAVTDARNALAIWRTVALAALAILVVLGLVAGHRRARSKVPPPPEPKPPAVVLEPAHAG